MTGTAGSGGPAAAGPAAAGHPPLRRPYIDRLRVTVIAGVIVFHAATAYVVDVPWYYEERTGSEVVRTVVGLPLLALAVFGLAPLFAVAGRLTAASLERHGAAHVAGSRLLRLGVPALAYLLLIDPLADRLGGLAQGRAVPLTTLLTEVGGTRDLGPMWFVVALLVFTLVHVGWRARRPAGPVRTGVGLRLLVTVAAVVGLADLVTWLRWPYLGSTPWNLHLPHWPQAAGLYLVGVLAGERGGFSAIGPATLRRCRRSLPVALAAVVALGAVSAATGGFARMAGGLQWPAVAFAALDGITAVLFGVWVVGWFRAHRDGPPGRVAAAAGRSSYATYLLHPLVLIGLSAALRPVPVAPELAFVLVAAAGVPLAFALGHLVLRLPGIGRVL